MSIEIRVFCPSVLNPKPKINPENKDSVAASLEDFAEEVNAARINGFMEAYLRPAAAEPEGRFFLSAVTGPGYRSVGGDWCYGEFYMDGRHGLLVGFSAPSNPQPLWLASISFFCGEDIFNYDRHFEDKLGISKFYYPYPIIVQLQGPNEERTYRSCEGREKRYKDAIDILGRYRWERASVDLLIEWSVRQNLPGMYMLPYSHIRYVDVEGGETLNRLQRFRMRMDVTAKRCGFRMQENGLYGLPLY